MSTIEATEKRTDVERVILFGIQDLQERCRWIAMEIAMSNLVDFVADHPQFEAYHK